MQSTDAIIERIACRDNRVAIAACACMQLLQCNIIQVHILKPCTAWLVLELLKRRSAQYAGKLLECGFEFGMTSVVSFFDDHIALHAVTRT